MQARKQPVHSLRALMPLPAMKPERLGLMLRSAQMRTMLELQRRPASPRDYSRHRTRQACKQRERLLRLLSIGRRGVGGCIRIHDCPDPAHFAEDEIEMLLLKHRHSGAHE
jgi:hypothetical protein